MVASFALLLGYYGDGRGEVAGRALKELAAYVDFCLTDLGRRYPDPHPLAKRLQEFTWGIANLKERQTLNRRLADYFYQFLAHEPFSEFVKNENRARNLAIFFPAPKRFPDILSLHRHHCEKPGTFTIPLFPQLLAFAF